MAELRKLDLSPIESKKRGFRNGDRREGRDIPEFVLYSIIIFGGKFSTLFIVSLSKSQPTSQMVK